VFSCSSAIQNNSPVESGGAVRFPLFVEGLSPEIMPSNGSRVKSY